MSQIITRGLLSSKLITRGYFGYETPITFDTIVLSECPVIEEILIDRLTEYLYSKCQWADNFPYFPLRINNEYPWVPYLSNTSYYTDGWVDLSKVSETLFPAITIVNTSDALPFQKEIRRQPTALAKTEYAEFVETISANKWIIDPSALTDMATYFLTHDYIYGYEYWFQRKDSISIDITVDDNSNIKNRLYDLCYLFVTGHGGIDWFDDSKIRINEGSVKGNRSGAYNMDFGRMLRGASIQFDVDYMIGQTYYYPDIDVIAEISIDHTVSTLES